MADSPRDILLEIIDEYSRMGAGYMQTRPVMAEVSRRLRGKLPNDDAEQQAVLTVWHDLFRSGLLAWGWDLSNPEPPWFHLTARGRATLKRLSRDPSNPDGYLAYLDAGTLDDVARAYVAESLDTYNSGCFKGTAVMVGCAAERLVLRVAEHLHRRLTQLGRPVPKGLTDWRAKVVRDAITATLAPHTAAMGKPLAESFTAYWPAFAEQIRAARNDAGHPASVDPVTPETVHASLLIFPELARLARSLETWIAAHPF